MQLDFQELPGDRSFTRAIHMYAFVVAVQRQAVLRDAELVKAEWTTDKQRNVGILFLSILVCAGRIPQKFKMAYNCSILRLVDTSNVLVSTTTCGQDKKLFYGQIDPHILVEALDKIDQWKATPAQKKHQLDSSAHERMSFVDVGSGTGAALMAAGRCLLMQIFLQKSVLIDTPVAC